MLTLADTLTSRGITVVLNNFPLPIERMFGTLGEIGYLQWRLFRMARVVADTGAGRLGRSWAERRLWRWPTRAAGPRHRLRHHREPMSPRVRQQPGVYAAAQGFGARWRSRGAAITQAAAEGPAFHQLRRTIPADGPVRARRRRRRRVREGSRVADGCESGSAHGDYLRPPWPRPSATSSDLLEECDRATWTAMSAAALVQAAPSEVARPDDEEALEALFSSLRT